MKWTRVVAVCLLMLWQPYAMAVPLCSDIFTDPPTGNHDPNGLYPPTGLENSRGNYICNRGSCNQSPTVFGPGDYNYAFGSFKQGNFVATTGTTTRLYFDNLSLTKANLNLFGRTENLIIYVRGNLSVAGQNHINGIVYVAGSVFLSGQASIDGALAAGGGLHLSGNSDVDVDLDVIEDADFGGMCDNSGTVTIDHFLLKYTDSPLTCKAEPVTIYACQNSGCTLLETSSITATLTAQNAVTGWEGGNQVTLVNGAASKNLWHTVSTQPVTIGVGSASVTAANPTLCQNASSAPSTAACTIAFADSGLLFDVPDKLAGKPASVTISAVKKDDSSQKCVPTFQSTSKSLQFWSDFQNPNAVIGSPRVSVNGADVGTSVTGATSVSLTFDATGSASMNVNYPDAGQLALNARYVGPASEGNLQLDGSDSFVSFPAGLCVAPADSGALCATGDVSCAVYKKAGEEFGLSVGAHAWVSDGDTNFCDNPLTPNFSLQDLPLTHRLLAPTPGEPGTLGQSNYDHQPQLSANDVLQSVSEVGVFGFGTGAIGSYLGSSAFTIPAAWSPAIGRFVPAAFKVRDVSLIPGCSGFSYMDQPTPLAMTIEAQNLAGLVTKNYLGDFAKGSALLLAENDDDGTDLSARLSPSPLSGTWDQGVMSFDSSHSFKFTRIAAPDADGPFELLDIGLKVDDNDGNHSLLWPLDMKPDSLGDCSLPTNECTGQRLGTLKMRHGRLVLENTYGPEDEILRMPARTQVWQGSGWGLSVDDSCTLVNPALTRQADDAALGYAFEPILTTGQSIVRSAVSPAQFSAGMLDLFWQAQGSPLYRGQVTAPLETPEWLQWYWNWDNSSPNSLYNPRASAYFGRFRGDDRIIFWREVN